MGEGLETNSAALVVVNDRPRCPFYGFAMFGKAMIDLVGNRCALVGNGYSSYAPCKMETGGRRPDWDLCPLNNSTARIFIEGGADSVRVFPNEFRPEGAGFWRGLSFRDWHGYIVGRSL